MSGTTAEYHLFIRTNRGVQLTPEGERLYTHVLSAMEQFQAAEEELADSSGLSHGSVAIGASETALNIFLLDKLKSFHMTYPGIRLKLYNHSTPEAIEAVKSGKIDFAVVSTPAEVDSPLKQIMLMPFQELLVGGTTFIALSSQELSSREVKNYPLISLGRETMTYKSTTVYFYHMVWIFPRIRKLPLRINSASGKMRAWACLFAPADGSTIHSEKKRSYRSH